MNATNLIDSLERFESQLAGLVGDTGQEEGRWRPAEGQWSILEIVTHLGDEEVEDFRPRLRGTLTDPSVPWTPIDPAGWVQARNYNDGDLAQALARFRTERCASIRWLRSLEEPDWAKTYSHPQLGDLRAGDLLTSWAVHDQLHLRQIAHRRFQLIRWAAGDYSSSYAGEWS